MNYYVGIDIGGTKTSVGIFRKDQCCIVSTVFATESKKGAENLVARISQTYRVLLGQTGIDAKNIVAAGVGCPGPLDLKNGRIIHIATMGLQNVPIREMLEKALSMPVYLENDANCAALAEAMVGAGKNLNPVVYVTVSTGVGCGIVINGKILDGCCSSAGEIGHLTVVPGGRECPCGKRGCLECYASGTAIAQDGTAVLGHSVDAKAVFALARGGDERMSEIIDRAADYLGLALSSVFQLFDPEIIVLGGSVTKDYRDFSNALQKALQEYTQPITGRVLRFLPSQLGEQVMLGAFINAVQQEGN